LVIAPVRDLDRFIWGLAFEIKLDGQGRFVMPKALSNYAQIKSEVVFVGLGDRAEIWASEKWSEVESGVEEKAAKAVEKIAKETLRR
jgi:MraZ protein